MALNLASTATLGFTTFAPKVATVNKVSDVKMESVADLKVLADKLNPTIGFYDPLGLAESGSDSSALKEGEAIGFLRHAEIKHGRVAMAAFVGYIVQSNGIFFPWKLTGDISYADIAAAGGPADQWDAIPTAAKLQILGFIGFLEAIGENSKALEAAGEAHYMRGGKPGFFPPIGEKDVSKAAGVPHVLPFSLFDPFGFSKKRSAEAKERGLVAEINNGRLAMIGIFGFLAESKVAGSVPGLSGLGIKSYGGEVMAPFSAVDSALPFVSDMLSYKLPMAP